MIAVVVIKSVCAIKLASHCQDKESLKSAYEAGRLWTSIEDGGK